MSICINESRWYVFANGIAGPAGALVPSSDSQTGLEVQAARSLVLPLLLVVRFAYLPRLLSPAIREDDKSAIVEPSTV